MFYDDDADLTLLDGKTVAILGYGSQGHAHALNLKDSGVDVVVGLRAGLARRSSRRAGRRASRCTDIAEAASRGDIVMVLLPDEKHGEVYREQIADGIAPGNLLLFGHGFSIHYGEVEPPPEVDVALVAPEGPRPPRAPPVPRGLAACPCLIAVHQDATGNARDARARLRQGHRRHARRRDRDDVQGRDRDRPVRRAGRALRRRLRARHAPATRRSSTPATTRKLAYFECLHELKLIVDLMYEKGITGMRYSISNTAEYGDLTRGKRIISDADAPGDEGRSSARSSPARSRASGSPRTAPARRTSSACARRGQDHQIEREGKELRSMMDWIETEF